ncbi:hypothetical protein BDV98DRAFT_590809 [Pterulicium gracile]|uniref:Uncharacterized protein n=1 Tax=Pterulicium gracile TaxID=1884261 RepID=A0A5C3QRD8_9AGAR|nr:hypothetical protein BDV98DRAFT_590809 [Pterula gracilis]
MAQSNSTVTLTLPISLARPAFKGIQAEDLADIDLSLSDVPPRHVRNILTSLFGQSIIQTIDSVKVDPIYAGNLAVTIPVHIENYLSDPPTHMLDLVLASYCSNLPSLPLGTDEGAEVLTDGSDRTTLHITLPIVPFCLPSPSTFGTLLRFMYTRDLSDLHRALFPCAPSSFCQLSIFETAALPRVQVHYAKKIADEYSELVLMKHLMRVFGLWRNMCVLEVDDETMWNTLDAAWFVLLLATALKLGEREAAVAIVGGQENAEEFHLLQAFLG